MKVAADPFSIKGMKYKALICLETRQKQPKLAICTMGIHTNCKQCYNIPKEKSVYLLCSNKEYKKG